MCVFRNNQEIESVEQRLLDNGYEGVTFLTDYSYDTAFIGVTTDNKAVYDFNKMVEWLMEHESFSQEDAVEWIEYNTIRALPYFGADAPIILYHL